jgi:murein DD-endopeptidase MepM/ murein hydrolase activator NlpD
MLGGCIPQMDRPDPSYQAQAYPAPYPAQRSVEPRPYERRYPDETQPVDGGVQALPTAPPAWQARPVTPNARTIEASTYIVQPGDTIRGVADRTGSGSEAIARANGLLAPFVIHAGQRLEIPGGRYHLVRAGETGIAIARAYGVDWSRVVTANALTEPYTLRVGMRVLIPGSGPVSVADRAAAFRLDVDDILTGSEPALATNQRPARPSTSYKRVLPSSAAIAAPTRLMGSFAWPVHGRIIARFGPGASGERFNGIKIAIPLDTPILAAADGVVAYAGNEVANLGGLVILKHGDGWTTVYGHASQLLVRRGQSVRRGQTIAMSGDSGFADRPELHFEIRKGRTPVDPLGQLPRL